MRTLIIIGVLCIVCLVDRVRADYWGSALRFDGADDLAVAVDAPALPTGNAPYTQEFWLRINAWPEHGGYCGFALSRGGEGWQRGNHMALWANHHLALTHWRPDWDTGVELSASRWYHVAATWDGDTERLYVNGSLCWSDRWQSGYSIDGGSATLGKHDNVAGYYLSGDLDEIRIWSYARSADEIARSFSRRMKGDETGLVAYYPLDEGAGQIAHDGTTNQQDIRLGASDEPDDQDPAWIESSIPRMLGDMNCDGSVDFNDIDPFIAALISRADYESQYPECNWFDGDINEDGGVDFNDIDGFVECLINNGCL